MYLITEQDISELTTVKQINAAKLKPVLENVDFFYIRSLLKPGLHAHYTSAINDPAIVVTANQKEVLQLVKRYFCILVHWDLLGDLNTEATDKGAREQENAPKEDNLKEKRAELYARASTVKKMIKEKFTEYAADFSAFGLANVKTSSDEETDYSPIVFY